MKINLNHTVEQDKYTDYLSYAYDLQDTSQSNVIIEAKLEGLPSKFNIGVVYGGSGTGKTTILKNYFKVGIAESQFDSNKSLISNFDWLEPAEAARLLSSMGLASVPTWLRPFHTLSNGEQYRAQLAYVIGKAQPGEVILIDEFTSVVDRNVAKAMSNAMQKYLKKHDKTVVLASCHYDIIEWLQPDWIYSPQNGRLEIAPSRRRETIELEIFRARYEAWNIFKSTHYMTEDLNKSAHNFIINWNNNPVGFVAILPLVSGSVRDSFRISRIVVLPDYQGLGIGGKIVDYFAKAYKAADKTMYIKTSNPALWGYLQKNWELCSEMTPEQAKKQNVKLIEKGSHMLFRESLTKSFKFTGSYDEITKSDLDLILFNADAWKDVAQNQISIFDAGA